MIRWLDFNDTWLAAEWGHPSDNLGGILAVADWLSRTAVAGGKPPLDHARRAHRDDQGARDPGRARAGEQLQPRRARPRRAGASVASTAVVAQMLGRLARRDHQRGVAWPGSTASACAPTATRPTPARARAGRPAMPQPRAVRLALIAKTGEMGYPSALTAKTWGFYDVLFKGQPFKFQRPYGSYVMENVLFKISASRRNSTPRRRSNARCSCIRKVQGPHRGHREGHDPHAGAGDPHHRQEGPARQSRRPRPLHPVHGRRAADLRPPHRRRLRGRRRRRSAHRRAARQDDVRRGQDVHQGLPRPGQALDRQRASRSSSGTARGRRRSSSSTRSATSAAARKACRC